MLLIFINTGLKELVHFLSMYVGIGCSTYVAIDSVSTTFRICSFITGYILRHSLRHSFAVCDNISPYQQFDSEYFWSNYIWIIKWINQIDHFLSRIDYQTQWKRKVSWHTMTWHELSANIENPDFVSLEYYLYSSRTLLLRTTNLYYLC